MNWIQTQGYWTFLLSTSDLFRSGFNRSQNISIIMEIPFESLLFYNGYNLLVRGEPLGITHFRDTWIDYYRQNGDFHWLKLNIFGCSVLFSYWIKTGYRTEKRWQPFDIGVGKKNIHSKVTKFIYEVKIY